MIKSTLTNCIKKKEELVREELVEENDKNQIPSPILMSGTKAMTGEGKMIVLVVGEMSCIGKLKVLLEK